MWFAPPKSQHKIQNSEPEAIRCGHRVSSCLLWTLCHVKLNLVKNHGCDNQQAGWEDGKQVCLRQLRLAFFPATKAHWKLVYNESFRFTQNDIGIWCRISKRILEVAIPLQQVELLGAEAQLVRTLKTRHAIHRLVGIHDHDEVFQFTVGSGACQKNLSGPGVW